MIRKYVLTFLVGVMVTSGLAAILDDPAGPAAPRSMYIYAAGFFGIVLLGIVCAAYDFGKSAANPPHIEDGKDNG